MCRHCGTPLHGGSYCAVRGWSHAYTTYTIVTLMCVGAAALAAGRPVTVSASLDANLAVMWSQPTIERTFRKFFPAHFLADVKFPCLEDLVNREELCA